MAVKKTSKKNSSIKSIKKTSIKGKSTNAENKLVERLQLKLEKSEAKIIELNEKYKKIIDINWFSLIIFIFNFV